MSFTHDEPGTDESVWAETLDERPLRPLPALADPARDHLVLVAAHPDDETLGAAGLLAECARRGWCVDVVVITDGEGSHPRSPTHPPEVLATKRAQEVRAASTLLAPQARTHLLGVPDGAVAEAEERVVAALVDVIGAQGAQALVCAPARDDGHPDHEAAGRAAATAARRTDAAYVEYPIWLWHWGTPGLLDWEAAHALPLDADTRALKARAVAEHHTQVRPLSDQPGDEVLLGPGMLAHFERASEVFLVREPGADEALDRLHAQEPDPWGVEGTWYERRKRAVTSAALLRERYERALEAGCSVGALAEDLQARCGELVAVDTSAAAVRAARVRLDGPVLRLDLSREWPDGPFDLVVVSETAYFLSPTQLDRFAEGLRGALAEGGEVVLCHWWHPVVGWPMDGPVVHERLVAALGLPVRVRHDETDFQLVVLGGEAPQVGTP